MGSHHTKVRTRSRVEIDLPADLRAEAHRLLLEGATYEQMEAWSQAKGIPISKSSWGRYGKEYFETYKATLRFEDQARSIASAAGDGLNLEEATTKLLLQRVLSAVTGEGFDILAIPRLLADVAKLQASSVGREKLKMEVEKKLREAGDKVLSAIEEGEANAAEARQPMNAERLKQIIRESYGV